MTTLQYVELGVLGPLQVRQYGLPVAVPGAKPRAVLTMLGLHGGSVVSADTLAELLWGAAPPRTAAKALQTHISSLRRTLGDGYVLTEGTGWTLNTSEIDAIRYTLAARLGRDAIAAGDAGQAVARFDEALALWRGIPELPDAPRGGSEKTRWIEGHAALVEDRADSLLATGRAAEIIGELEAAIADAPLRERRWGQLMLALYRAGRQGEALGAYQRARSLLADELGVDPGPDLRRLETAIVAQDAALEVAVAEQLSIVTRAVTFLLTDIEGSTAAWEADADAMAVALARHDEIVEQVVTSRGGRLVKTRGEGDATFSVFDRPSAAAAAAIELQEAIRHEPWALAEPMRIRVALHTGEVELRNGDYFGRAVNRAARLRSLAAGGQILCSGATAELVIDTLSDDVVLVDLGMRHLRNLSRPEHVFELRLETAEDSADPNVEMPPMRRPVLPTVLAGHGPFVGRGPELEGLLAAWQSMLAAGTRAMLIAGEPGVGKTRLAGEWSRRAYEQGAVVLYGRCDEDLGAAYQPFAEALRSLVPCVGASRLRELRGVEALLPLVPGLTDVVPDLSMPSRADPDTERYALFDAVVALLTLASASAPVVLILDDLHWAAKPTLLLLRHLLRFGEQARVQILGTYRSTDLDRSHPLAAMLADLHRDGSASRLTLGGLDEDDVTAYVAEAGYDDVELARALASVTGGNPFFLIEALRHVDESGGRWDPSTLPQGVREAVSRRLSRLPAETNKALAAAAVVGSRFPLALVESVVGEDLVDAFDEACKAGIVIEEPGGRYRFNHALVRQSLLAELASVRRMRLHQKIATTLEAESGADDELLAELAYHYFECAWAGNAAKAVEYCRRAADQAIERLAYEGAADLYDRALHALEELDDELPDRDAQQAELLVARCEALLAAGDVGSAAGAVAQLQRAAGDSVRLAAWGTCFDGQLSMLTDPERLDEIESEVSAAAQRLAELDDAAGEANAHTVRAACLARLGRIADCETALDQALTAARRARDHRRVNAVLAGAPLAALWGPNPVPRAGGRCLDVVRLLRITTGSPVVEATSTRCQGVLDAMRGRAAAGRQLIDSARRALTELGMRHALLEVDQFAGIVELVADDPAAAEPHLRRAYVGFRRMGLDADTAETAAFLARACLALDRDAEADELCRESERLAGHALRPSITWRTVRAQLHARVGAHDEARRVAGEAVSIAERTDALVDHGDACLTLAMVLAMAGDTVGSRAAAEQAVGLFERKGAAALVERARSLLGTDTSTVSSAPEVATVEPENECVRTLRRVEAAVSREAWSEVEQAHAEVGSIESRRKIVGFERMILPASRMASGAEKFIRDMRAVRTRRPIVAIRGERLALTRTVVGTSDDTPGAPLDEMLQLVGLDEEGRIALQIWFDIEDLDAAMAELDAVYARLEKQPSRAPLENAASRADHRVNELFADSRWEDIAVLFVGDLRLNDLRRGLGREAVGRDTFVGELKTIAELGITNIASDVIAIRGERLALVRIRPRQRGPEAFYAELLRIVEIDVNERIVAYVGFDVDDVDTAIAGLDARYLAGEAAPHAQVWRSAMDTLDEVNRHELGPILSRIAYTDHRRLSFGSADFGRAVEEWWALVPDAHYRATAVHALDAHGTVATLVIEGADSSGNELQWSQIVLLHPDGPRMEVYEDDDLNAALTRFDELSRPTTRLDNAANRVLERYLAQFATRNWDVMAAALADDFSADDRRRVVTGSRRGREAEIANFQVVAELGCPAIMSTPLATRGERLVLALHSMTAPEPQSFQVEFVDVVEINSDNKIVGASFFDLDQFDTAVTELDARYLAGEAAPHAHTWSVVVGVFAALARHEAPAATPDWISVDHRRGTPLAHSDLKAIVTTLKDLTPNLSNRVEAVHLLSDDGALFTQVSRGTSQEGFDAEWRIVNLLTVDGDKVNRCELFDEADLDAALARFEELDHAAPQLENAASRVQDQVHELVATARWEDLGPLFAADLHSDDRRRGLRREYIGRDSAMAESQATAALGAAYISSTVVAVRGQRLALTQVRLGPDERSDSFRVDFLRIVEVDADDRVAAFVTFDQDDFNAALDELDARYAAGEAAPHARTWSVVTENVAAFNRHEFPASTPDVVNVDHRRVTAFASGDLTAYVRETWQQTSDLKIYIESVHRLNGVCAVFTYVATGTSQQGFAAEWRAISASIIDGDLIKRSERFDEVDLRTALARFDELAQPATPLDNAASHAHERFISCYASGDWDGLAATMADDFVADDRRKFVGTGGTLLGRNAVVDHARVIGDLGVRNAVSTVIALRGQRLALMRARFWGRDELPDAFNAEVLHMVEIDERRQIATFIGFDVDDLKSAITELDARYVEGEAAPHARTWSVITENCAALNQQLLPAPPDFVYVDRRRVASIGAGDVREFFRAVWELTPDLVTCIESVHRLSDLGAVVSQVAQGTSDDGFYAEWRVVNVYAVDDGILSRCEVFDETDLDTAIARFDELSPSTRQPQNAASRMMTRFQEVLRARDWDGMAEIFAEDICLYDRRPVVGVEFFGRDATIANMRASADTGVKNVTSTVVATRGSRLVLQRVLINGRDERPEAFRTEALGIGEVDAQNRLSALVMFDLDDLDAAFKELDARYLGGEAAAHAQTYSVIADAFAAVNRHELPTTTTPDFVSIDHRRPIAFAPGEMMAYLRATLNDAPEIRIAIEAVHRLSSRGVVVSHAWHNTSQQGFDAEWRVISISMLEGGQINRCELFDETDLDAALARFDELSRPALRLQTAASKLGERFRASFAARDWDAMAELLADDLHYEDRRRVVNAGIRHGRDSMLDDMRSTADMGISEFTTTEIATRGERLVLVRAESCYDARPGAFYVENLAIAEIDADERMTAQVMFDLDEADAAFEELDKRYVAGEAAPYADTWAVIAQGYAALNRHEIPPTTPDWVNVDHRRGGSTFAAGDMATYIRASWEDSPQNKISIETVHRLSNLGAVVTSATRGVSIAGFYAEWRQVDLVIVDGNMLCRTELFDEQDLLVALAKFDELSASAPRLDNAATRLRARASDAYNRRDLEGFLSLAGGRYEDRRKGLRDAGAASRDFALAVLSETPTSWRLEIEPVAIRGNHLALSREAFRDGGDAHRPITVELMVLTEFVDELLAYTLLFDPDDIDAALAELDARFVAGDGAAYSHIWTLVNQTYARFNRHELSPTTPDWVNVDHRRGIAPEPGDMHAYVSAMWAVAPDVRTFIESVHRLTNRGAVFTHAEFGTSQQGFDAEWREVTLLTFDGNLNDRCELFDENDIGAALARFDELSVSAPRLENVATQKSVQLVDAFNRRDLDGYLAAFAANARYDDRRKGLRNEGSVDRNFARGVLLELQSTMSWHLEAEPVAIRGRHLALNRYIFRDTGEVGQPVTLETLALVVAADDGLTHCSILFDADDIDAAFEELETRYVAGEAAGHADVWSVIAQSYAELNRHELAAWIQDVVHLDHRTVVTIDPNDLAETLRAGWELVPDLRMQVEAVHKLNGCGAIVTNRSYGTSQEGFDAEWRMIQVLTIEGNQIKHFELFDEADVEAAAARLDQLSVLAPRLENAATRGSAALADAFGRRDLDGFVAAYDTNAQYDDRRKGLRNTGSLTRDFGRGLFEFEATSSWRLDTDPIAIRGNSLALLRHTYRDTAETDRPIMVEALLLTEADDRELLRHCILFDPDDIDVAFEELDARYLAGEAGANSRVWACVARTYAGFNRREISATTPDWVNISHRRGIAFAPGDMISWIRAAWDVAPDVKAYVRAVHRLTAHGAVVTIVGSGTSREGFDAEWREIHLITFQGDLINRNEDFEEGDLDAALARFDELYAPAPLRENAATLVVARLVDAFNRRDIDSYLALFDDDGRYDDRRKGLRDMGPIKPDYASAIVLAAGAGWQEEIECIAVRGTHLLLCRAMFRDHSEVDCPIAVEALVLAEVIEGGLVSAFVVFDCDDIDAASTELTARWIASGEVEHPDVIEAGRRVNEAYNRHEWDEVAALEAHAAYVNHRQLANGDDETIADHWSSIRALAELIPDMRVTFTDVLVCSKTGMVNNVVVEGTTGEGTTIELPAVILLLFEGTHVTRMEAFDLDQRDQAVARFGDLNG